MLKWDRTIIAYVKRQAYRVLWACPIYEIEDLVQEGWIVFGKLQKSHGRKQIVERHGELDDQRCRAAWMALFKVSLRNRFRNIMRSASRSVEFKLMSEIGISRELESGPEFSVEFEDKRRPMQSVEIACDLDRAPAIRHILESASWDDGVQRIRSPRRRPNGEMEVRVNVLQRIAGRKAVREFAHLVGRKAIGDFDAQLSMVV